MGRRTLQDLQQKQALPLEVKLRLTQARIVEWYRHNKRLWMPNKSGLGMAKVFDMINDIYGKSFYRYE